MTTSTRNSLVGFVTISFGIVTTLSLLSGTSNNMFGEYLGTMFLNTLFGLFGKALCWIVPVILFVVGWNLLKNGSLFSQKLTTIFLLSLSAGFFLSIVDLGWGTHLSCSLITKTLGAVFGTHLSGAFVISLLFLIGVLVWKFQIDIVSRIEKLFGKKNVEEVIPEVVVMPSTITTPDFADGFPDMVKLRKELHAFAEAAAEATGGPLPEELNKEFKRLEARAGNLNIEIFDEKVPEEIDTICNTIEVKEIIKTKLEGLKAACDISEPQIGPVVTWYGLRPALGVRIATVSRLAEDLSVALGREVRLTNKPSFGIEVSNDKVESVCIRDVIRDNLSEKNELRFVLGKDIAGNPVTPNLIDLTHLLVAGTTNSGKSSCLSSMIASLIFSKSRDELRLVIVDPKGSLSKFNGIPHLVTPVITNAQEAIERFQWVIKQMEERYSLFRSVNEDDILKYNESCVDKLPFIVVVVDEIADLVLRGGKDFELKLKLLAQKARAAGIFLILATQRPDHKIFDGLIKANIPARIALKVNDGRNSRIILDEEGAEDLLGKGDMLFKDQFSRLIRVHGAFIKDEEIARLVEATRYATRAKV